MAYFLKGNYELSPKATSTRPEKEKPKSLTERMEESALARLGGSVCFVVKKKTLLWAGDADEAAG
jgi:hypothetical protein